jgi:hypothetical protein
MTVPSVLDHHLSKDASLLRSLLDAFRLRPPRLGVEFSGQSNQRLM